MGDQVTREELEDIKLVLINMIDHFGAEIGVDLSKEWRRKLLQGPRERTIPVKKEHAHHWQTANKSFERSGYECVCTECGAKGFLAQVDFPHLDRVKEEGQ